MDMNESLLRAILATVARRVFSPDQVYRIVSPTVGGGEQLAAYNMCDGKTAQADIGKKAKLDHGNLSRSISRWVEAGIVMRVGPDQHALHVYPLTKNDVKSASREK